MADSQEFAARAKEHGWVKPQPFNYKSYEQDDAANPREGRPPAGDDFEAGPGTAFGEGAEPIYGAMASRYEWEQGYGEVGPRIPALEKELFRVDAPRHSGREDQAIWDISVVMESESKVQRVKSFKDIGLHPTMEENVELCGYTRPTPIQAYCIPAVLQNRDLIAISQTGSGKTAAFFVPILSKLMGKANKLAAPRDSGMAEPLVLVLVPTRELAVQIFDEARRLSYRSMLRPCVVYGGGPTKEQLMELRRGCDILVATPGRLIDFIGRGNILSLRRLRYTVLDEADELVGDDWAEDLSKILEGADNNQDDDHHFLMFSATFPAAARALAREYLDVGHVRLRVGRLGSSHTNITQDVVFCDQENKRTCVRDLLCANPPARTMIFVNSKKTADFLDDYLYNNGLPSTSIHADRTQREREDAIRAFRNGKAPILVTTGVSARGLDIVDVMHVVNYDLPSSDHGGIHEYVHRIGRTARIGQTGIATALYNDRNEDIAVLLVKTLIENRQAVPDFLQQFRPEGDGPLDFEDDSETEDNGGDNDGNDGNEYGTNNADTEDDGW